MESKEVKITCNHVSFCYGKNEILHDISCTFEPGVTGILGANGAGKTTWLSLLSTLTIPNEGTVSICGKETNNLNNLSEIRPLLGYLPQNPVLMKSSSVYNNVRYAAWAHGVSIDNVDKAAETALKEVGLFEKKNVRTRKLSGGQKQRLAIACAIVHRPRILIFDEPSAGLDPQWRIQLRELLQRFGQKSVVIVSTHIVDDVARGADRVLLLEEGHLTRDVRLKNGAAEQSQSHGRDEISGSDDFDDKQQITGVLSQNMNIAESGVLTEQFEQWFKGE